MQKRPPAISAVSWILIVYYGINLLLALIIVLNKQKFLQVQQHLANVAPAMIGYFFAAAFIEPIVNLISAIGILMAANWARYLFLIFNAIVFMIVLFITPKVWTSLIGIIIFFIFLYFLFNKKANLYFKKTLVPNH